MEQTEITVAVAGLPEGPYSGSAFRHQAEHWRYGQPGAGARTAGGRWNPPNSFATLYLGDSREVVAAEFRRMAERSGRAPSDFMPRELLEYRIELSGVLDLTASEASAAVELDPETPGRWDMSRCQKIGEAAHHLGREGVVAPSATGVGTVLAAYPERLKPDSVLELVRQERWDEASGASD